MTLPRSVIVQVHMSVARASWEPEEAPDGWIPCCMASAVYGPRRCTCWEPAFDQSQAGPVGDCSRSDRRDSLCHDCAYRPGSPERSDPEIAGGLMDLPLIGHPFYCHQGMRRLVRWVHPDGRTYTPDRDDYHPGYTDEGLPLRADGSPAALCEGWRRLKIGADRARSEGPPDDRDEYPRGV